MKKQKIIAIALGAVLTVGGLGSLANANTLDKDIEPSKQIVNEVETTDEKCEFETIEQYTKGLIEKGVITSEEASKLVEIENKADKLFEDLDKYTEDVTDEQIGKVEQQLDKLFEQVEPIYDKIDEYEISNELLGNKVLTQAELDKLKEVKSEVDKLYKGIDEENVSEEILNNIEKQEEAIYEANKDLIDKVEKYFDSIDEEDDEEDFDGDCEVNFEDFNQENAHQVEDKQI